MRILAIDTASFPASAAVLDDNIICGEYIIRNKRKHSQNIMVMTERLLDDLAMDISEIDIFAVTVGPGSFTGLRIGISSIRAFAQAMNKPVVGVSTLEALAYNFVNMNDIIIVPMLDARRDEVFTAAYSFSGGQCSEKISPRVMTIGEICEKYSGSDVIFTGDGAAAHREELAKALKNAQFALPNLSEIHASALAVAAKLKAEKGLAVNHNEIVPLYLRKSQAERELENKKGHDKDDSNRK